MEFANIVLSGAIVILFYVTIDGLLRRAGLHPQQRKQKMQQAIDADAGTVTLKRLLRIMRDNETQYSTIKAAQDIRLTSYILPTSDIVTFVLDRIQAMNPALSFALNVQLTEEALIVYNSEASNSVPHVSAYPIITAVLCSTPEFIKLANELGVNIHSMRQHGTGTDNETESV